MTVELHRVFFDLLSGVAALLLALGVGCVISEQATQPILTWLLDVTFVKVATVGLVAYLVGIVVDGVGFTLDKVLLDRLPMSREYEGDERRALFLAHAPEHLFAYRNTQWQYFICYRNLFLLLIPGSVVAVILVERAQGQGVAVIVGVLLVGLVVVLGWTAVSVAEFYYTVEMRFARGLRMRVGGEEGQQGHGRVASGVRSEGALGLVVLLGWVAVALARLFGLRGRRGAQGEGVGRRVGSGDGKASEGGPAETAEDQ